MKKKKTESESYLNISLTDSENSLQFIKKTPAKENEYTPVGQHFPPKRNNLSSIEADYKLLARSEESQNVAYQGPL